MNGLANKQLERLETKWSDPYKFYEDSCLITQIYLGGGILLSTTHQIIEDLLRKKSSDLVEYHSHNADTSKDAHILMVLFDSWVKRADALKSD